MPTQGPTLGRPVGSNSEQTRQRIMAATVRCVADVGYARATIRQIAREADMTSGTLYHYFSNKAELVKTTFNEISAIAVPRFIAASHRDGHFLDRLLSLLDEFDQLVKDYPYVAAFEQAIRVESAQHLHLAVTSATVFQSLRDIIEEIVSAAHDEGALDPAVGIDGACGLLYALMRGLSEQGASVSPDVHHATLQAAKSLVQGNLFHAPNHHNCSDRAPRGLP